MTGSGALEGKRSRNVGVGVCEFKRCLGKSIRMKNTVRALWLHADALFFMSQTYMVEVDAGSVVYQSQLRFSVLKKFHTEVRCLLNA